jgi:serine/threonine-protein kinase
LLVVVMLLLLGAGAAFAVIRAVTPTYAVPAVTGPMLAALDQAPLPHHFKVRERHVSQDGTTAGQVLVSLQAPPAGAKRQSGSTITVTISDGQSFVGIPNLHGMTEDAAKAALGVVGLVEGNVTRPYRDDVPPGQVVSWSPQGQLRKGSPVDLVISAGSAPIAIPDVSGLSLADARAKLAAAGLTQLANDQVYSTTVTSGQVVGTDPAAGANGRGVTITVHVSKGPQIVKVPDMTGETVQQATADLGAIGLHVGQVFGVGKNGHVVATDPAAGQAVPQGSAVDLFVDR